MALRPAHQHGRLQTSQVDVRREQGLVRARVVGVVEIGLPAARAAVAGSDRVERRQAEFPFVLRARMREACSPAFEIGGVDGGLDRSGWTRRWRRRFADTHAPAVQRAAIAGGIVTDLQRPGAAGVFAVEPRQTIGKFGLDPVGRGHGEGERQRGLVVEHDVHQGLRSADRCGADVGEQAVVVAGRRDQVDIEVLHEGVVEIDRDVDVGNARIARNRQRRTDRARSGRNRLRHVGGRVGRAGSSRRRQRQDRNIEIVGRVRAESGGHDRIDVDVVGTGVLDREEESFGVRIGWRATRIGVVGDQDLVGRRVAEQGEAEAAVPDTGVTLGIHVETEEDSVAGIEGEAVEVRLAGRDCGNRAGNMSGGR